MISVIARLYRRLPRPGTRYLVKLNETFRRICQKTLNTNMLYSILALREQVFTIEQKCTEPDLDGLDRKAIHIVGIMENVIFGTARILPPGIYKPGVVSFGRLVIKKSFRSKGYGKSFMDTILGQILEKYADILIEFSAQTYLIQFYEKFGFIKNGETYQEGGIPHCKMKCRRGG